EGSLCAQLCLNNLLQEEYFRPGELSSVAHQLGENGRRSASEDYHTFLQQPSGNMDHRAFYSIQVILYLLLRMICQIVTNSCR
uniref:ubiquitinyl hydrolase 1 n=1 Tax=Capra hircus TaxID=9925 RepID=A0A452EIV3_CAPHI